MKLNDIAEFVTDKISSSGISLDKYVTTDSLLQNRRGMGHRTKRILRIERKEYQTY